MLNRISQFGCAVIHYTTLYVVLVIAVCLTSASTHEIVAFTDRFFPVPLLCRYINTAVVNYMNWKTDQDTQKLASMLMLEIWVWAVVVTVGFYRCLLKVWEWTEGGDTAEDAMGIEWWSLAECMVVGTWTS